MLLFNQMKSATNSTKPEPTDLTKLLKPYMGEWVALSQDEKRVLGHGKSIEEALTEAKEKGENHPFVIKVPDNHGFVLI